MRAGSLFSGVAGLDRAAESVLGAEAAWFVEHDPAASKVLAYRYPGVPNYGDITTVNWETVEPVDVITAGFPCQDISNAGRQAGIEGARSGLWSHVVGAVRVLRPRYLLVENVSALVVRGLDRVLADLASVGFDAEWTCLRASDVGACHRRERVFLVAVPASDCGTAPNTAGDGRNQGRTEPAGIFGRPDVAFSSGAARDAESFRRDTAQPARGSRQQREGAPRGQHRAAPDANGGGLARNTERDSEPQGPETDHEHSVDADRRVLDWGPYGPAIERWEAVLGRAAPVPTIRGARGGRKLNPALPEWMMGFPKGWITDVPGVSVNEALKLAGNAVCEQQAAAAFRWLIPLTEQERAA